MESEVSWGRNHTHIKRILG